MKEIKLIADENGERIDLWLSKRIDNLSRSYVQKLIDDSHVTVNSKIIKSNHKLKTGEEIEVTIPELEVLDVVPEKIDIDILYEDDDIIVVNKPQGMVVHPAAGNYTGTLVNALMQYCGERLSDINGVIRPGIVHRIDKDTSGVLVVAKSNAAHSALSERLKEHDIKRVYLAVVEGVIREDSGRIDAPISRHPVDRKKMAVNNKNGRRAVTYFKVLERLKDATFVEVQLETGRTHQIRVHMSFIGFPIIGDPVYGRKKQRYNLKGQILHAKVLGFVHPTKNEYMEFQAELPEYFKEILNTLKQK